MNRDLFEQKQRYLNHWRITPHGTEQNPPHPLPPSGSAEGSGWGGDRHHPTPNEERGHAASHHACRS